MMLPTNTTLTDIIQAFSVKIIVISYTDDFLTCLDENVGTANHVFGPQNEGPQKRAVNFQKIDFYLIYF